MLKQYTMTRTHSRAKAIASGLRYRGPESHKPSKNGPQKPKDVYLALLLEVSRLPRSPTLRFCLFLLLCCKHRNPWDTQGPHWKPLNLAMPEVMSQHLSSNRSQLFRQLLPTVCELGVIPLITIIIICWLWFSFLFCVLWITLQTGYKMKTTVNRFVFLN